MCCLCVPVRRALVSVVVKLVYIQTIPQLLLVWIAFILYRLQGPTCTSVTEYTSKQQKLNGTDKPLVNKLI